MVLPPPRTSFCTTFAQVITFLLEKESSGNSVNVDVASFVGIGVCLVETDGLLVSVDVAVAVRELDSDVVAVGDGVWVVETDGLLVSVGDGVLEPVVDTVAVGGLVDVGLGLGLGLGEGI